MKIEYRKAEQGDINTLASMNKKLIEDEGHSNPMTVHELAVRMEGFLNGEYEACLLLLENRPSGYCLFRDKEDCIFVRQLYVEREIRRKGFGSFLLKHLRETRWDNRKIRAEALCHNPVGLAFWRKAGFKDYCITLQYE